MVVIVVIIVPHSLHSLLSKGKVKGLLQAQMIAGRFWKIHFLSEPWSLEVLRG